MSTPVDAAVYPVQRHLGTGIGRIAQADTVFLVLVRNQGNVQGHLGAAFRHRQRGDIHSGKIIAVDQAALQIQQLAVGPDIASLERDVGTQQAFRHIRTVETDRPKVIFVAGFQVQDNLGLVALLIDAYLAGGVDRVAVAVVQRGRAQLCLGAFVIGMDQPFTDFQWQLVYRRL